MAFPRSARTDNRTGIVRGVFEIHALPARRAALWYQGHHPQPYDDRCDYWDRICDDTGIIRQVLPEAALWQSVRELIDILTDAVQEAAIPKTIRTTLLFLVATQCIQCSR